MSNLTVPVPQRGFGKWRWTVVVIAAVLAGLIAVTVRRSARDGKPTLYHHADGHFTLNRKDGPAVTPLDLRRYLASFKQFGTLRIIEDPNNRIEDLWPLFFITKDVGLTEYRMEVNGRTFDFSLPPGGWYEHKIVGDPEIIHLRSLRMSFLHAQIPCDVAISVDRLTTCDSLVAEAEPRSKAGKSVAVLSDTYRLCHYPSDGSGSGEWVRRPPLWWEKHVQPQLDRLRKMF